MPTFSYRAINRSGEVTTGETEAADVDAARRLLAERGLFTDELLPKAAPPEKVTAAPAKKTSRLKLRDRLRVEFISQLATALTAQLPLLTALKVVGAQHPHARVRELADKLAHAVRSGQSLSQAMAAYPRTFDPLHLSLVSVGEAAGRLDRAMTQLAELTEREYETRASMTTAALYPAFVLSLGIISVVIIVTWILPQVIQTLAADVGTMPWPTRAVMAAGQFMRLYGAAVTGGLLVTFFILRHLKNTPPGRYFCHGLKLKLPIFGPLQRKWAVARFARTLGTLTHGGVPLLEALTIVRNSLGNEVLAREIDELAQRIRSGSTLAGPMRQSGQFPPLLVQIVAVGEQTGGLGKLLLGAANAFDKDTTIAVRRFMAVFPAILILLLAVLVGFIVAATLLPIVQIETGMPGL